MKFSRIYLLSLTVAMLVWGQVWGQVWRQDWCNESKVTAHTEWLLGVQLRHSVSPCNTGDCKGWWFPVVIVQWSEPLVAQAKSAGFDSWGLPEYFLLFFEMSNMSLQLWKSKVINIHSVQRLLVWKLHVCLTACAFCGKLQNCWVNYETIWWFSPELCSCFPSGDVTCHTQHILPL